MEMFCYQCEQTVQGKGCTKLGVCGKDAETANIMDLLIFQIKGIALYADKLNQMNQNTDDADKFMIEGLFTTITNVDFDFERIKKMIFSGQELKESLKERYLKAGGTEIKNPATDWQPQDDNAQLLDFSQKIGLMSNIFCEESEDTRSLKNLILFGLKGVAAYTDHASVLGYTNKEIFTFMHSALAKLTQKLSVDDLVKLTLETGEINLKTMELLDKANTETFGHPEPTPVWTGVKKGPAILVSGHDLLDLYELLVQTEGKGINIYTHGEMLPCLAYPKLKKFSHLIGNYGSAWQNQKKEFDEFPGPILMTTNCIQKPKDSYEKRIWTTALVGMKGLNHISDRKKGEQKDFSVIIKQALDMGGIDEDRPDNPTMTGFGHHTVLSIADKLIGAIKEGKIKHIFLVGGCDGAKPGRNYFTEFVEKTPKDTLVLTLACGKYRFNKLDIGKIGDLPRLIDMGQCNDSFSAIKVAGALAEAFNCGLNDLPLSLIISWYEQKAVCVLLTLLHLGIKNIHLGPTLPAFVSENVLKVLVDNFNIKPITTAENDLNNILKV
jgi:hydroxylamine reductase